MSDLGHTGRLFAELKAGLRGPARGGLVGYLPVGFPSVEHSLAAFRALCGDGDGSKEESRGVDLVEVGLPYSDPVMDGKTIQKAGTRALQRGVRTRDVFAAVETIAATGTPAVVMTYWNLVERYGTDAFARDLAAAGGAGVITPDLTPDEAGPWFAASDAYGLDRIFLVSPSSTELRLAHTVDACRGWVYATALMGVTGARAQVSDAAPTLVARVRAHDPRASVGVGVGVSDGAQAGGVTAYADAVIVGSALVQTLVDADEAGTPDDLTALRAVVADLVAGVRASPWPAAGAADTAVEPGTSPAADGF